MQEFSSKKQQRPQAIHGVVFNSDKSEVLLVKRRDIPVWVLPGGGLDAGETPEEGTCREVLEETGYQVSIVRKVAEYLPVNRMTQFTHLFECKIIGGKPTPSSESSEVSFFPLAQLPKMPPPYASWIRDAHLGLPDLIVKKIAGVNYWVLAKLFICHPLLVGRYLMRLLFKK